MNPRRTGSNARAELPACQPGVAGTMPAIVSAEHGAGGRGVKHDGVKRTPLEGRPAGVMGWLDVDAYFDGWSGPDLGDF